MDLTGQTLLGKYEIEGLLGQGGMGAVWLARHALTGRKLAIKVLDESYLGNDQVTRRFGREARAASTVQHPGIVEVLDLDQTEAGVPFLVMEFLEGETLARRIERRGRLGQEELVRLGRMLLEALDAAHTHGVIHRDLKPENIYVVPAGRRGELVKILDFGISHMTEDGGHKLTMTGSVLGTPHYMSPEQAMGETEIDHRADLYAAGVVLYECAVGDVPFDAPNYNKLLRIILDNDPPPPRSRAAEISEDVERVILWAMEKSRDRRLSSASEMMSWLERADAGERVPYEPRRSSLPAPQPAAEKTAKKTATSTPRPAGTLPHDARIHSSLTEVEMDRWRPSSPGSSAEIDIDVALEAPARETPGARPGPPDEEDDWQVSPTLARRASTSSFPPARLTPGAGLELEGPDLSTPSFSLELDESTFRPSSAGSLASPSVARPSVRPPAVGTASTSGAYAAVGAGSSAGTLSVPPSASSSGMHRAPPSGLHDIPPRVATLSGRFDAVRPLPVERASWTRYALLGAVGLGIFVGLVALVRWVVDPGVDEALIAGGHPPAELDAGVVPTPDAPRQPNWIRVDVVGLPPGARMSLDGLPASSPVRVRRGGTHVLEITAPGYEDRRLEFEADRNRSFSARMRPATEVPEPP